MTKIAAAVSERSSASTCQAGNSLRRPEGHRPEESINIQGTKDRYALRKQRDSIMVLKAAIDAVKLATACGNSLAQKNTLNNVRVFFFHKL